jgi:uridine kinase
MASAGRRTHYEPPWGNASIIGVAGSSGSGKTSLALAIVASLNLPWVVILSMVGLRIGELVTCPMTDTQFMQDSFYKPLTPEQSAAAFRNEHDFDSPEAIDFDSMYKHLANRRFE